MDFDNEVSDDEIIWEEVYDQVTQELNFAFRPIDSIPSCVFYLNKSEIFLHSQKQTNSSRSTAYSVNQ